MKNQYTRKARHAKKRNCGHFLNIILLVGVILTASAVYNVRCVSAHERSADFEPTSTMQYKSIVIQDGDNLWNIATEYVTDDFDSVSDYIRFLKNVNNLSDDTICVNQTLIVAYAVE